jgi:hypothetical protein
LRIAQTRRGARGRAEPDHARATGRLGEGPQARIVRIVRIQDRHAARLDPLEDLALGLRDRFD